MGSGTTQVLGGVLRRSAGRVELDRVQTGGAVARSLPVLGASASYVCRAVRLGAEGAGGRGQVADRDGSGGLWGMPEDGHPDPGVVTVPVVFADT